MRQAGGSGESPRGARARAAPAASRRLHGAALRDCAAGTRQRQTTTTTRRRKKKKKKRRRQPCPALGEPQAVPDPPLAAFFLLCLYLGARLPLAALLAARCGARPGREWAAAPCSGYAGGKRGEPPGGGSGAGLPTAKVSPGPAPRVVPGSRSPVTWSRARSSHGRKRRERSPRGFCLRSLGRLPRARGGRRATGAVSWAGLGGWRGCGLCPCRPCRLGGLGTGEGDIPFLPVWGF